MKILEKAVPFIPPFLFFWWLLTTYWFTCEYNDNYCSFFTIEPTKGPQIVKYENETIVEGKAIQYALSNPVAEINESLLKFLNELADFLKKEPSLMLKITGVHHATKEFAPHYINLGLMRARILQDSLITKGITRRQITINGKVSDSLAIYRDSIWQVVDFQLYNLESEVDTVLQQYFSENTPLLFLDINTHDVHVPSIPNEKAIYLEQLRIYLKQHLEKKAYIYPDSKFTTENAQIAKNYLESEDFNPKQIEILKKTITEVEKFKVPIVLK